MIIPSIQIEPGVACGIGNETVSLTDTDKLCELVRPLAALNTVNLYVHRPDDEMLIAARELFRRFDCWVCFVTLPQIDTIRQWLDAGARKLAVHQRDTKSQEQLRGHLPDDRIALALLSDDLQAAGDNVILPSSEIQCIEEYVDAFCRELASDRDDGLWPTIVCDAYGVALGLVYSNRDSVLQSVIRGKGVYWSRSRNELWEKGATSGATSRLIRVDKDCDGDALRITVHQQPPGFCHQETRTCFGDWTDLSSIQRWISHRGQDPAGYTSRLLKDPRLLRSKLQEEAGELADADDAQEVTWEAADVVYFTMVAMARSGVDFQDVTRELQRRTGQLIRRPGDAKQKK